MSVSTEPEHEVLAAGAVVVRFEPPGNGSPRVLIVHRPRYDDWSFPKGKLDPGEHPLVAAVREVGEETGVSTVLRAPLPSTRYRVSSGEWKSVRYWQASVRASEPDRFRPNKEVDERVWVPVDVARQWLTHPHDRALLDQLFPPTTPLILLRHAEAMPRRSWSGADIDRPLTELGLDQARRLVAILTAFGIERVVSSPARRCVDTIRPYADSAGVTLTTEPDLTEESPVERTLAAARALRTDPRPSAWCVHRPKLPVLAEALGVEPLALEPGELVAFHRPDSATPPDGYVAVEAHTP